MSESNLANNSLCGNVKALLGINSDLSEKQKQALIKINRDRLLEAAIAYAKKGVPVFPCTPQHKSPYTQHGFHDASTDELLIREWWKKWPDACIGLPTGTASGVFVVDPDEGVTKDGRQKHGIANWNALCSNNGGISSTLTARTAHGGLHLYFSMPAQLDLRNSESKIAQDVDVRANGGYVVAPPSVLTDGGIYEWVEAAKMPADAPQWLIDYILNGKSQNKPERNFEPAGSREATNLPAYVQKALDSECEQLENTQEPQRNGQLNKSAFALGQLVGGGVLSKELAIQRLFQAADKCGLLTDPDDGPKKTRATIESGLNAGMKEPRGIPQAQTNTPMTLQKLQVMTSEEFDDPLLLGSDTVPEIDTEHLPKALASIVDELSEKLELPPSLVLVPALAIPATVAQRKYRVRVNDSFSVPLTMYCLGVASPANKKTSIFTHTSEVLDSIANAKNRETADERAANAELRKTYSQALAALEKGKKSDIERLMKTKSDSVSEDDMEEQEPDICSRIKEINDTYKQKVDEIQGKMPKAIDEVDFYIGGDTNLESLFLLGEKSNGYMAVLDDEGKFFEIITGLYNDGRVDTDLLTKGYDGSRVTRARVSEIKETGKPKVIEHAHLTASFIIQPTVFQDMAKTSSRKVRGRGLYGRFLIAFPETYIGHRKNENRAIDRTVFSDFNAAIERVFNLELWTDQFGNEQKEVLRLSEGAENVCKEFIQCVETLMQPTGDFAEIQDWAGKATGHIHRLAGLFHLFTEEAQGESLIISEETMRQAVYVLYILSYHALRFFNAVSEPEDVQLAKRIARWLTEQDIDVLSQRDAWQRFKSSCHKVEDLQPSLKLLEDRAYIFAVRSEPSGERGRPKGPLYFVNPKLKEAKNVNA